MNKKKFIEEGKRGALYIIAVALGFVSISFLWSIGGVLILEQENYWGLIPLIIGYEIFRTVIKFMWKHINYAFEKETEQ